MTILHFLQDFLINFWVIKLQITPLKFGGVWILNSEASKFRFYPLKFGVFGFYTLMLHNLDFTPKVWECLDLIPPNS